MKKLFLPSAGPLYVYRPSKRRRVFNRAVDKLEKGAFPGYEYVIAHLYDKYYRNLTISTIGQTGKTLSAFLAFLPSCKELGYQILKQSESYGYGFIENS